MSKNRHDILEEFKEIMKKIYEKENLKIQDETIYLADIKIENFEYIKKVEYRKKYENNSIEYNIEVDINSNNSTNSIEYL